MVVNNPLRVLCGLTVGSIPFAGSNGCLTEDNTNLFWDNTNKRLGIGSASPQKLLDVNGAMVVGIDTQYGAFTRITGGTLKPWFAESGGQTIFYDAGGTAFVFRNQADNAELMRITDAGLVGIGTPSPGFLLDVSGGATNEVAEFTGTGGNLFIGLKNTGAGGREWFLVSAATASPQAPNKFFIYDNTAGATRLVIDSAGNVGIGTTGPTFQLQLSTDSAAKPSTNTWTISSDRRIKKEIRPFRDGLETALRINPVWYKYNGLGGFEADEKDQIGVIGQDIQKVAPYTVNCHKAKLRPNDKHETELLNFNSHALPFILINAVKELHAINESLKMQNEALEKRVAALEKRRN